jgi:outer membrane protein assembly factor BamB/tRNA A-37 threonylcarbamoyl transferase component Bud32
VEFNLRDKIDGQFKVVEKHRGGMSVLYVVLDDFSQKRFAVKTLKEEGLEDRQMINRFAAEARTWMNIPFHENVVQAIICREMSGQPFLFLEYVEGTDLQTLLEAEAPLALPQVLNYALQSCRGMAHVHNSAPPGSSVGVVHRDIKPGNLMITRRGTVKVTDFGLAKAYGTSTRLTPSATGMGTYTYMPPEQFVDAGSADRTSDIYSFGVVLYQALTGSVPFTGANLGALMNAILNKEALPPSRRNADVPSSLDAVVLKCVAKRRDERYQRFEELLADLTHVGSDVGQGNARFACSVCGFLTTQRYPTCHVCSGQMQPIAGQAAAADELFTPLAVGADGGIVAAEDTAQAAPTGAPPTPGNAQALYEEGVRLRDAGDLRQALGKLRAAHDADPTSTTFRAALDDVALAYAHSKRKRADAQTYNWPMFRCSVVRTGYTPEHVLPPLGQRWQFRVGTWVFGAPTIADGVVFAGGRQEQAGKYGRLCAIDRRGNLLWETETAYEVYSSPAIAEGKQVYVGLERRLMCLDAQTGIARWDFPTHDVIQGSPAVWRGVVYIGSQDGNVYAVDAETGRRVWVHRTEMGVLSSPTLWKGAVFIGSRDHNLYALSIESGARLWAFMTGDEVVGTPAYVHDAVVVGSLDHRVYCIDAATGKKRWEFRTNGPVESSPAIANGLIYIGSRDRNLYALDAATGERRWAFATGDWVQSSPAVSGGVVYCGSHDGCVYGLEAETGAQLWRWELGGEVRSSPAVGGGVVVVGCNDGYVYCFNQR